MPIKRYKAARPRLPVRPNDEADNPILKPLFPKGGPFKEDEEPEADDVRKYLSLKVVSPPIRQSNMGNLWACPRFYLFKDRLRLTSRKYKSAPAIGSMFHLALGLRYQGQDSRAASAAITEFVNTERRALHKDCTEHGGDTAVLQAVCDKLERDADLALVLAEVHWRLHPLETKEFVPMAVELKFDVYMPEAHGQASGTMDLLLYSRSRNGLFICDHKTVGKGKCLTAYSRSAGYDFQARMYRYALTKLLQTDEYKDVPIPGTNLTLGQVPVLGFAWNLINKPSITHKRNQTHDDYLNECLEYYTGTGRHEDKRDRWLGKPPTKQTLVRFVEPIMSDELWQAASMTARASQCVPRLRNFPRFGKLTHRCRDMFGSECEFGTLCATSPLNWAELVKRDFRVIEDEPETEEPDDA